MSFSVIPESAPFNEEQRAWLNGFLAGWVGSLDNPALSGLVIDAANGASSTAVAEEVEEEFPWHDPGLDIDERLQLAEEKPLNRRLMAAMAQLDCGACGYICQTYSEAIAAGEEKNLTLCSPGGKETAKMLKRLVKEEGGAGANAAKQNGVVAANGFAATAPSADSGYSRNNPFVAKVKSCVNLNGEGSAKHTTHAVIDLEGSGLDYQVGDSLGVYPTNCPELVDELLRVLNCDDAEVRRQLIEKFCLRSVTDELLELLASRAANDEEKTSAERLIDSDDLDEMDVLDALRRTPSASLAIEEFLGCLNEMTPRLYSIASSLAAHPGEVHLTVGKATTIIGDRLHKGVASTMFADRLAPDDTVRVYVHPSHGFTVPSDPTKPMIMVGPGTGIAPFRAFLEERNATGASGKNWLFFGDQHEATDYLYRDELESLEKERLLTKISTAFSRDQAEKVYVQDRMQQQGAELYQWLEEGAYFFVCGDAKRMAVDVDRTLHELIAQHGGLTQADAQAYVTRLKTDQRYVRDVY